MNKRLTLAERRENEDLLDRMRTTIIKADLETYLDLPAEKRPAFEEKILKLKIRYNNIKKRLNE